MLTKNEEKNIGRIIEKILSQVEEPMEILVVDDSADSTPQIVNKFSEEYPNIRLAVQDKKGYTSALRTAVRFSQGEALVILVGDTSDEITDIEKMRDKLREGFDVVCASRYMKNGSRYGGNAVQGIFSFLVGKSLRIFLGIPTCDISNSFKMYRKEIFDLISIKDSGFAASMQITLKAFFLKSKITEIPTVWKNRSAGSSKFLFSRQSKYYIYWYFWALSKSIITRLLFWRDQ